MCIRRVLALGLALFISLPSVVGAQKDDKKRNKQEEQDIQTLVALVDSASSGTPIGVELQTKVTMPAAKETVVSVGAAGSAGDVPIAWESAHFVRGQDGKTYVPFTLQVDPKALSGKSAALFVRAVDKRAAAQPVPTSGEKTDKGDKGKEPQRPEYAWENIHFIDVPPDGRISRAMAVPGGEYDFFAAIKDKNTGDRKQVAHVGLMRKDVTVPDLSGNELTTSSVILAERFEPLEAPLNQDQQQENPYVFGSMRIVPTRDGKFKNDGELQVIFWIYGATIDASKKPDMLVEYNFHNKTPEGEKYFNKTAPQAINATTLPPNFDIAAGHQVTGSIGVPLASFPAGEYRLEIKITDKPSGKTLTRDVTFSVVA